jgi:hypothetical protein
MLIFYFLLAVGIGILPRYIRYRLSNYKIASGNSFFKTAFDKGNYGEFLTFSYLEKLGKQNKLMTNVYIQKTDGTTTEVDLIMLSETGIYVFESKNYSGWIFGDEKNKNWTQSLQNKQKNKFYNPIWQNRGHISALKDTLGIDKEDFYKSYIIFSERCTLKKITVTSPNVKVIKRNSLVRTIKKDMNKSPKIMTVEDIAKLYSKLQKYTLADEVVKKAHIDSIKARKS